MCVGLSTQIYDLDRTLIEIDSQFPRNRPMCNWMGQLSSKLGLIIVYITEQGQGWALLE